MYKTLLTGTAILFSVVFLISYIKNLLPLRLRRFDPYFIGTKYAIAGLISTTFFSINHLGMVIDLRVAFAGIASLFGGWRAGLIAALVGTVYRVTMGGSAIYLDTVTTLSIVGLGSFFHFLAAKKQQPTSLWTVALLTMIYLITTGFWLALLPGPLTDIVFALDSGIIMLTIIGATFLFSMFETIEQRRKIRDTALREYEILYDRIQEIAQLAFSLLDPAKKTFRLSRNAFTILGLDPREGPHLSSERVLEFVHPDDRAHFVTQMQKTITDKRPPGPFRFRVIRTDGDIREIWTYAFVPRDAEGYTIHPVTGIVGIIQDVTEQSILFEQLAHSQRLATIGEFASSIGHEINTPLSAAILFATSIEERLHKHGIKDPFVYQELAKLNQRLYNTASATKAMTTFARMEPYSRTRSDVHDAILEAVNLFRDLVSEDAVQVDIDLTASSATILGDPARLQQIIMNLLTNARHATQNMASPCIKIHTFEENGAIKVEIQDNGHGIRSDQIEKIFEPFFTTKKRGQGTGLGLSIVRRLVNDMNGQITVRSQFGSGTTFFLSFPLLKDLHRSFSSSAAPSRAEK